MTDANSHNFVFTPGPEDVHGNLAPLVAFRDFPSADTHEAAAKLIHRLGPLAIHEDVYSLLDGKVIITRPTFADQTAPR